MSLGFTSPKLTLHPFRLVLLCTSSVEAEVKGTVGNLVALESSFSCDEEICVPILVDSRVDSTKVGDMDYIEVLQ